jgi:hypothetical protein
VAAVADQCLNIENNLAMTVAGNSDQRRKASLLASSDRFKS